MVTYREAQSGQKYSVLRCKSTNTLMISVTCYRVYDQENVISLLGDTPLVRLKQLQADLLLLHQHVLVVERR